VLEGEGVDLVPEAGGHGAGVRFRRPSRGHHDRWGQ
jgi:hypothetical protein